MTAKHSERLGVSQCECWREIDIDIGPLLLTGILALKYSLMIGFFFLWLLHVVLMVSIPIVIRRMKSKSNKSSSGDKSFLDLSYEERWDYINQKAEEIRKKEEEKISQIESKAGEIMFWFDCDLMIVVHI